MEPIPTDSSTPTRRRVLAVGAAASAAVLAGCGSGGEGGAAGQRASNGGAAGSAGATGGRAGSRLVSAAKVPVGGGVILDRAKVVVTQPSSGTFEAFSAVCTHMQCLLGQVADGVISCPCHGSAYSAKDGSVQRGPATRPLAKVPINVEGDEIVQA